MGLYRRRYPGVIPAMFTQLLFVDNQCLGELARKHEQHMGAVFKPRSIMLYCPTCGDVWCRAPMLGGKGSWLAYAVACRKHPDRIGQPGGTLYQPWLMEFYNALTEGALRRELDLWWNFYKGTENERF